MKKTFNEWLTEKGIEDIAALDAEKQAELYNEFNELKRSELEKAIEEKASKEDIEAMKVELKENQDNQILALNKALKDQGVQLKRVVDGMQTHDGENLIDAVAKGLKANEEKLKALGSNAESKAEAVASSFTFKAGHSLVTKAPGTMSITSSVTGEVPQALLLPGLNTIASRQVRFLDALTRGSIGTNLVRWAYQANKEGAAGQTGEGLVKNQIDFEILTDDENVVKTTAFIKVTDEMVEDIAWMQTEINNELLRELMKAIEQGAYNGDGTGNNLHGVYAVAPVYAAGAFAGAVDNANLVDVLTTAVNQIQIAEQSMPNVIWLNPSDVTALKLEKVSSTDKRYVERLAMIGGNLSMDGIPIVPTTLVDADNFLIGDFTKAYLLERSSVNIEVGLDADDFTKNLRTIRAEWRGVCYVKTNDRTAFVKGSISAAKAALETT